MHRDGTEGAHWGQQKLTCQFHPAGPDSGCAGFESPLQALLQCCASRSQPPLPCTACIAWSEFGLGLATNHCTACVSLNIYRTAGFTDLSRSCRQSWLMRPMTVSRTLVYPIHTPAISSPLSMQSSVTCTAHIRNCCLANAVATLV